MLGIATVVYNQLDFCKQAIEGVLNNTEGEYAYALLFNDSPYDGVLDYLKTLTDKVSIMIISEENLGVSRGYGECLNALIKKHPIDYFAKVDDDTVIQTPGWNTKMLAAYKAFPRLGILSADIDNGKQVGPMREYEKDGVTLEVYDNPSVGGACTIYPLELFKAVGFYGSYGFYGHEDGELAHRARLNGYMTAYLKGVDVKHLGRTAGSDKDYDDWKIEYWFQRTDKDYPSWKKEMGLCSQ